MECKKCGHDTEQPVYRAVRSPTRTTPLSGEAPAHEVLYKRWACESCGRFHFADGTLYANPYPQTQFERRDPAGPRRSYHEIDRVVRKPGQHPAGINRGMRRISLRRRLAGEVSPCSGDRHCSADHPPTQGE